MGRRLRGAVEVLNPATEEVLALAPEASVGDAAAAAASARAAQPGWAGTPATERAGLLDLVARRLLERRDELVALTVAETGFVTAASTAFVDRCAGYFAYAARAAARDLSIPTPPAQVRRPDGGSALLNGVVQRRPIGVVACIVPFNGPLYGAGMKSSLALATGNTVVVKPAPQNPLAVLELFRIFDEVGFPAGVVNVVTSSDPAVGAELAASTDVDMVSFTGSTAVGQKIYEAGSRTMKRLLLECGGKGACLVFDDADLDAAARGLGMVWTLNSGQVCAAPTRALVQRGVYEELLERLGSLAASIVVGAPTDPLTVAGPVISAAQRERVEGFVSSAADEGATIVAGGARPPLERGFFVAPTLLGGCRNDMDAARNEIFGPVIAAIPFDDDDEAIALANDSEYGLVDYVYSRDLARAFGVADRLQAGTIQINTTSMKDDMPRGGVKRSGLGRNGGEYGLLSYTEPTGVVWV